MRDLIKAGCVTLVLSLSLAAPVAAGPLEDGVAAYESGDYATALRLLRPLAEQGNARAQNGLGVMYDADMLDAYRIQAQAGSVSDQAL